MNIYTFHWIFSRSLREILRPPIWKTLIETIRGVLVVPISHCFSKILYMKYSRVWFFFYYRWVYRSVFGYDKLWKTHRDTRPSTNFLWMLTLIGEFTNRSSINRFQNRLHVLKVFSSVLKWSSYNTRRHNLESVKLKYTTYWCLRWAN